MTFGSLKACGPCSYDLADAMSSPFDEAVCEVDQHCGSSHAVHQLDMLKGRLTVMPCTPVHATAATLKQCNRVGSTGMIAVMIAATAMPKLCDSNRRNAFYSYSFRPYARLHHSLLSLVRLQAPGSNTASQGILCPCS